MSSPSEKRVPELVSGVDVRTLPLSALEGFVFSRVDGRAPVGEIVAVTGFPQAQVTEILERLRSLGAVRFKGEPAAPSQPVTSAAAGPASSLKPESPQATSKAQAAGSSQPAAQKAAKTAPAPTFRQVAQYDPRELEEECDLVPERRKQVLDLYYALNDLDYYEALGIPYDADKKEIRAAYFALSKAFHPDTMFRKELGSFKAKMEFVFKVLTEGYETLSKKKSREEYDAYLRATKATKMAERAVAMAKHEAEQAESALNVEVPRPPAVPQVGEPVTSSTPPASQETAPTRSREATPEARRLAQEVIARRLRGAMAQPPGRALAGPSPAPEVTVSKSAEPPLEKTPVARTDPKELLRRLTRTLKDVGQVTGTNDQVGRTVKASEAALARGDLNEATELMRKAMSMAPDRPDLKHEWEQLSRQRSEKLANDYLVQAQYEAKQGKWAAAALAWGKVCEGRPNDAMAHHFAAQSLLKAGGDLRGAQRYAQQASYLAPEDVDVRVLLAQIYLTLGLKLNAKRELDAAAKLDPGNEMVKNLLSDLKS